MSHAIRNSLIIFLVICCFVAYFFVANKALDQKITKLNADLNKVNAELRRYDPNIEQDIRRINHLQAQVDYLEVETTQKSKFFLAKDESKITWEYTQQIINRFNQNFRYQFSAKAGGNSNEYTIAGTTRLADLYAFVSHIEGLGALYTIENMTITPYFKESETGPINDLYYTIVLKPHVDASKGRDILNTPFRRVAYGTLPKDPFRPGIHEPMADPNQERFVKYEDLKFVSFTKDTGYFINENGQIVTLKPNQPVAYGYFSHIDSSNRAVFRINRTGLYDTVYKNLQQ